MYTLDGLKLVGGLFWFSFFSELSQYNVYINELIMYQKEVGEYIWT